MLKDLKKTTVGLNFISAMPLIMIKGMGWQIIDDHKYFWDSKKRASEHWVLQYTVDGEGEICIGDKSHRLNKGDAFIINIPGNHYYRLPPDSKQWEVLYIEFSKEADVFLNKFISTESNIIHIDEDSKFLALMFNVYRELMWEVLYIEFSKEADVFLNKFISTESNIIHIDEDSKFLALMFNVYRELIEDRIDSIYKCSSYGYQLIMELLNEFNTKVINEERDIAVVACKNYIDKNYHKQIGLDDLTDITKLSKYHLSRKFKMDMGTTPGNYLIRIRLEKAMELILSTDDTIDTIAKKVGFSCGNYFSKVFRKNIKVSPLEFKNKNSEYSINKIVF